MRREIMGRIVGSMVILQITLWGGITMSAENNSARELYEHALKYEDSGQTDKAINAYQNAIERGGDDVRLFLHLGLIYKGQNKYQEAITVLTAGIMKLEKHTDRVSDVAKLYNNLGNVYRAKGDYENAINAFDRALKLEKRLIGANLNMALCYDVGMNQPQKAVSYYLAEIETAPDAQSTYEAYLNLGIYYQEKEKDIDKSIGYLKKAISVNPNGSDRYKAYNSLANSLYLKGDVEGAIANWQKVVDIAPNSESGKNARHNISVLKK